TVSPSHQRPAPPRTQSHSHWQQKCAVGQNWVGSQNVFPTSEPIPWLRPRLFLRPCLWPHLWPLRAPYLPPCPFRNKVELTSPQSALFGPARVPAVRLPPSIYPRLPGSCLDKLG